MQKNAMALVIIIFLSLILINKASGQIDGTIVEAMVKNSPCSDGQTIDEALKNKINSRSQRDLGWQVFNEQGQYEVERAFLMNKSMQLRFRWHVTPDGSIKPVSSRAESLCSGSE